MVSSDVCVRVCRSPVPLYRLVVSFDGALDVIALCFVVVCHMGGLHTLLWAVVSDMWSPQPLRRKWIVISPLLQVRAHGVSLRTLPALF